jgi:hypothetical protein
MPIDPNIALGVRPIEQPNMLGQMAQVMAMRQAQQEYENEGGLRNALTGGLPEDPTTLLKYGKSGRAIYESALKGKTQQLEANQKKIDMMGGLAGFVRERPTPENFASSLDQAVSYGLMTPAQKQQVITQYGGSPESIKTYADQTFQSALTAKDRTANETRIQAANIGAAPGHRQASVAEQKFAIEKSQQAEIDALFGKPSSVAPTTAPMGGGGGKVPNALAPNAAPAPTNMLVPSAQAPVAAPIAAAPVGDVYDQIKALDAKIAPLVNTGNPRASAIVQQLIAQRNSLVESAKRQYGGDRVDMSIPDPNDPSKSITVKGQIDQYGVAQPLRAGAMPRDVDISTGTSFDVPVARPAPPAPVYKDIVNPNNDKQMITINVNEYKGGGVGAKGERAPGVLGVAGKEPTAALREQKTIGAEEALKGELDNLRFAYGKLNEAEAIPSTARSGVSNLGASTQASDTGQFLGKVFGTTEQSLRDNIKSSNLRLLQSIKNATGMSAQELNSNMELKTWIDSLTNPKTAYETNIKNIDNIETFVRKRANRPASGGGVSATGSPADPLGIR